MLYGKRIRIRAIEEDDLPWFVKWLNDPEVIQGLEIHVPMSMAQEKRWFERLKDIPMEEHPLAIEVQMPEDGWKMIGNLSYHNISRRHMSAELGIFIGDKEYWDKGYGGDALCTFLNYGFFHLNLNRICLRVLETNKRAIRAYEKVGFIHEGKARQGIFQQGKYIDLLWMSILRDEWRADKS